MKDLTPFRGADGPRPHPAPTAASAPGSRPDDGSST
jgi:hypothetical protein